jgi:hypothetical protein
VRRWSGHVTGRGGHGRSLPFAAHCGAGAASVADRVLRRGRCPGQSLVNGSQARDIKLHDAPEQLASSGGSWPADRGFCHRTSHFDRRSGPLASRRRGRPEVCTGALSTTRATAPSARTRRSQRHGPRTRRALTQMQPCRVGEHDAVSRDAGVRGGAVLRRGSRASRVPSSIPRHLGSLQGRQRGSWSFSYDRRDRRAR